MTKSIIRHKLSYNLDQKVVLYLEQNKLTVKKTDVWEIAIESNIHSLTSTCLNPYHSPWTSHHFPATHYLKTTCRNNKAKSLYNTKLFLLTQSIRNLHEINPLHERSTSKGSNPRTLIFNQNPWLHYTIEMGSFQIPGIRIRLIAGGESKKETTR